VAFASFSTPAYACASLFDPTPAPSFVAPPTAAPGASGSLAPAQTAPPPGFVQPDMGHLHVPIGERVRYANCPPASGKHYQVPGGPIKGGLYGPSDATIPQGWVHNLEHGAIVLLYRCKTGDTACTDERQAALGALLPKWPNSPICQTPPGTLTPVITRFDDMPYPYAALVWDVVLPMQTLDETSLFEFYKAYGERFNGEKQCAAPSASPGPAATPASSATVAPSGTAAPSGTTPAASSAASPS
jgi:hypothetical protein